MARAPLPALPQRGNEAMTAPAKRRFLISSAFALLAALAYAAGKRPLAYIVAAGALLSYESGYLALFALPLFTRRCNDHRQVLGRASLHAW